MHITTRRAGGLLAVAALVLSACSSAATTPSAAVSAAPSTAASEAPSMAPSEAPSASESAAPTTVATVPDTELITATRLTICSDIPYPPQEFFDANGNPTGSDIDIGTEIAKRLGLTAAINNTVFDTIIAALQGSKCDIIISAQNITSDRIKQVDMIPFFQAGQSFVVDVGQPRRHQRDDRPVRQDDRGRDGHDRGRLPPGHRRLQGRRA